MTATASDVDRMTGVVSSALWGPGGVRDLVASDPERARLMDATTIVIDQTPSTRDRALAQVEPGQYLLGLWTSPPSQIQLFASDILALGADPVDVVVHELGHAWDFDHGAHCPSCTEQRAHQPHVHSDTCPVCLVHTHAAIAMGLMDGLRLRAHLEHVIPAGLGGTIPEARWHIRAAQDALREAAPMVADPTRTERLRAALDTADRSLSGWLGPERVSRAYVACRLAWDLAYDVNHQWWAAAHHP